MVSHGTLSILYICHVALVQHGSRDLLPYTGVTAAVAATSFPSLLRGLHPQVPHLDAARDAAEGADGHLAHQALLTAPVHGERRPGEVAHDALAPGGAPLALLLLGGGDGLVADALARAALAALVRLVEEPAQLHADEGAPEARAPARRLALRRRRPVQKALGRQVGAVLERLERHARDQLSPGDRRLDPVRTRLRRLPLGRVLGPGPAPLLDQAAAPEVHVQQPPQPHESADVAQQDAEGLEAPGYPEDEGDVRGREGLGREDESSRWREGFCDRQ